MMISEEGIKIKENKVKNKWFDWVAEEIIVILLCVCFR